MRCGFTSHALPAAILWFAVSLGVAGCSDPVSSPPFRHRPAHSPVGLVALPCENTGTLQSAHQRYCDLDRNFVTQSAAAALRRVAVAVAARHPGYVVRYMEASWPSGVRPMPPHLSHGDGRQIDLALFYTDRQGHALRRPPSVTGYAAYAPPQSGEVRSCINVAGPHAAPDPPADRTWHLDEAATADLLAALSADPAVRRIFVEPHLKLHLGFARDPKVRFAGCRAARHDDHLHVDFF